MKRDVIFALIFLVLGFAIGFWTGANNSLAPLVTVENVQDEEETSNQDSFSSYEGENNPSNITAKTKKTTIKNKDNSVKNKTTSSESATFNPNALTVVSFIQDWFDSEATISLKNNTDRTISSFKATIIYKDMKGEILDYQEINKRVEIAPHMAKKVKINAYGRDNDYAYYLSEKYKPNENRVFKIEFKLNSYK